MLIAPRPSMPWRAKGIHKFLTMLGLHGASGMCSNQMRRDSRFQGLVEAIRKWCAAKMHDAACRASRGERNRVLTCPEMGTALRCLL